jgi:hypothetical protein
MGRGFLSKLVRWPEPTQKLPFLVFWWTVESYDSGNCGATIGRHDETPFADFLGTRLIRGTLTGGNRFIGNAESEQTPTMVGGGLYCRNFLGLVVAAEPAFAEFTSGVELHRFAF